MAKPQKDEMESTRALMGALLRQPPNQHDAMRIGKKETKKAQKEKLPESAKT